MFDFDVDDDGRKMVQKSHNERWKDIRENTFMFLRSQFNQGREHVSVALDENINEAIDDECGREGAWIRHLKLSREERNRLVEYLKDKGFDAKLEKETFTIRGKWWSKSNETVEFLVVSVVSQEEENDN